MLILSKGGMITGRGAGQGLVGGSQAMPSLLWLSTLQEPTTPHSLICTLTSSTSTSSSFWKGMM